MSLADDSRLSRADPTFFGSAHRIDPSAKKPILWLWHDESNKVGTSLVWDSKKYPTISHLSLLTKGDSIG